mmetsp:Transcript_27825/g.47115  ORF Transcript_27825/g.47115 Transcript_27825/m.47115 type:complete len:211 (-) Transcript_27825:1379-2011(-)
MQLLDGIDGTEHQIVLRNQGQTAVMLQMMAVKLTDKLHFLQVDVAEQQLFVGGVHDRGPVAGHKDVLLRLRGRCIPSATGGGAGKQRKGRGLRPNCEVLLTVQFQAHILLLHSVHQQVAVPKSTHQVIDAFEIAAEHGPRKNLSRQRLLAHTIQTWQGEHVNADVHPQAQGTVGGLLLIVQRMDIDASDLVWHFDLIFQIQLPPLQGQIE